MKKRVAEHLYIDLSKVVAISSAVHELRFTLMGDLEFVLRANDLLMPVNDILEAWGAEPPESNKAKYIISADIKGSRCVAGPFDRVDEALHADIRKQETVIAFSQIYILQVFPESGTVKALYYRKPDMLGESYSWSKL